jgi:hypothetical protein
MTTAIVHDITPALFHRQASRQMSSLGESAQRHSIFSDMADGTVIAQFFLNFAGFEWNETKFFMQVVGLCGEVSREVYDKELAEYTRCTARTIRAWRAEYLARAQTTRCSLLVVNEGAYNPDRQRYERTGYSVPAHVAELIEQAVASARALPEYSKDRLGALEKAAGECYDEIPDAPPMRRRRKPKKSQRSPVIQSIGNAAKSLSKGQKALADMPERMRAALLAGQGDELRAMLLKMRNQIEDILTVLPEDVEDTEDRHTQENSSGVSLEIFEASNDETHFRVKEESTRKRADEPEHSPEAISAWASIEERLTKSQIQTVEVDLIEADLPPHSCPDPGVDPTDIEERAAVICEGNGVVIENDAPGFEQDAERRADAVKQARRDLCEVCRENPFVSEHERTK